VVVGMRDDEPMCMHTMVSVSSHAANIRSHTRSGWCNDGRPSGSGFSVKVMAWLPLAAHRRTSSAASPASQSGTMVSGTNRPWPSPAVHSSIIQSL
jgi:hypothetical protein